MSKKHRIALITSEPENISQQRIMDGVFTQCNKYNYDVAVITPLLNTTHFLSDNLVGELNIYNLINFDLFDGVIITPSHMFGANGTELEKEMAEIMTEKCHCKVVALEMPFNGYETVYTDEVSAFYEIAQHVYEVHSCKKVYFLSGHSGYNVSDSRRNGFLKYANEHGIDVPETNIISGDYWYTSGEKLADEIADGTREKPDAVICASDHMAIGLVNRLVKHGIRVPEDVIVTGYDATQEAVMNDIYVVSYIPRESATAAEAVNILRQNIEPGEPVFEVNTEDFERSGFYGGESCGCPTDMMYLRDRMRDSILRKKVNWSEFESGAPLDVSMLLDSYMSEKVLGAPDSVNCVDQIYHHVFLLHPYGDLWLCMKNNWLDLNDVMTHGYTDYTRVILHSNGGTDMAAACSCGFCDEVGERTFETKLMLPEMLEDREENSVFYFAPIHGGEETLGYAVMRCALTQKYKINYVYHNWLRITSYALSMTRIRNKLSVLSLMDVGTDTLNRAGLEAWMKRHEGKTGNFYIIMADMNGLKMINDHYGHNAGDYSLRVIANCIKTFVNDKEDCARIGGDEFVLVGMGDFDEAYVKEQADKLEKMIAEASEKANRGYEISASIGYAIAKHDETFEFSELLEIADTEMYCNKRRMHRERRN